MPDEVRLVLAFALALGAAFLVTPRAIAVAVRADFHDHPGGYKGFRESTPYLGGAAVLTGFLLAAVTVGGQFARLSPILFGALVLWVLGTVDDRRHLSPSFRLAVEGVVAIFIWANGLGWDLFASDAANLAITILWTLAIVNAFNLMDNMDGAAATIAAVTGLSVGALAMLEGDPALAALSVGLAGACLGFLPYNLAAPARVYLGDGGSVPIGFVVAATIMALPDAADGGVTPVLSAVLLVGLLGLDPCLVIVSRLRAGVPLMAGARDHLTHRLLTRLHSPRAVAGALGAAQATLGIIAIGVTEQGSGSILTAWSVWFVAVIASVALLETRSWVPAREASLGGDGSPPTGGGEAGHPVTGPVPSGGPEGGPSAVEVGMIAFVGLACGLSPFLYGFYELSVWGPIGLVLLAALVGLVIVRPVYLRPQALVALGALVALWLWATLSILWSESADQALTDANRWLLYAALFAVLLVLVRNDRLVRVVLGAGAAAVMVLAVYVVGRMLVGDGPGLFLEGRLNDPLGYINGVACYLLIGLWPLVAVAERGRALVAGLAASGAVLLLGLVVLTQTRSIVPALLISSVVVIALAPGRSRRLWFLLGIGAVVLACLGPLLEIFDSTEQGGSPDSDVVRDGALALVLAAALAGAAWAGIRTLTDRAAPRLKPGGAGRTLVRVAPFAVVAVVALGGLAAVGNPVAEVRDQYRTFKDLEGEGDVSSRFTSGSGNRYDFWRVAWVQFSDHPAKGVGAGNYDTTYFLERRTDEDIRQPHSVVFQSMAELGLVGILLLAAFAFAVLAGLGHRALAARGDPAQIGIVVAAGGAFVAWLVQATVDWVHLVPGITGLAFCAGACLVGPWRRPGTARGGARRQLVIAVACGLFVLFGAVMLGRATLADHYRSQGEDKVATDSRGALADANQSLDLNDESLDALYLRAAAYARLDDYQRARASLVEATRREPHDYVPWALLGDLATRRGDRALARRDYRRAVELNPRDTRLREELSDGTGS